MVVILANIKESTDIVGLNFVFPTIPLSASQIVHVGLEATINCVILSVSTPAFTVNKLRWAKTAFGPVNLTSKHRADTDY